MTPALILAALASLPSPANLRCAALAPSSVVAAETHRVSGTMMLAIAYKESRCNPAAVGSCGEVGAWQTLPRYAKTDGDAHDGARMLARWKRRADGNTTRALQAYNAGHKGLASVAGVGYAQAVLRIARWL